MNCILAPRDSDTVCQSLCAGQKPLASQCQSHCDWHHDSATTDAKSVALLLPADGPEPNPSTFPIQNVQLRVMQKAACKNSSFFDLLHTTRVHSWICLLHSVHCIMVDHCSTIMLSTELCLAYEICTLAKFRADVLFPVNFMILLHTSKQSFSQFHGESNLLLKKKS